MFLPIGKPALLNILFVYDRVSVFQATTGTLLIHGWRLPDGNSALDLLNLMRSDFYIH